MYFTRFEITGRLAFPLDMLRYDHCFPATQEAVSRIQIKSFPAESQEGRQATPVIELRAYHSRKTWTPTTGRWESFGWRVIHVDAPVKV